MRRRSKGVTGFTKKMSVGFPLFRSGLLSLMMVVTAACSAQNEATVPAVTLPATAEKLSVKGVENFHRVSKTLYRSGQPTPEGFTHLQAEGIRSVLNLREYHKDTRRARHTNLHLMAYPMAAGDVKEADVENCLRLIAQAPGPVLVHCWHGSDRTGIVVAAWRIVYENWTVAQAEAEFRNELYGHHEFWYGNLMELLHSTDWNAMRKRLTKSGDVQ